MSHTAPAPQPLLPSPLQGTQYLLTLLQHGQQRESFISQPLVSRLLQRIQATVRTARETTEINLLVHSPGGDANAAYKLCMALRAFAAKVRVFVPDYAKSAATLIAIACDELFMAPGAELGPLDVQIPHPDRENVVISGLDHGSAVDFLAGAAMRLILEGGAQVLEATQMTRQQVLDAFTSFASAFLAPVISKIDPQLTNQAARALDVAKVYAHKLLLRRQVHPSFLLSSDRAFELAQRLVHMYPTHAFVIGREDVAAFGLPVFDLGAHQLGAVVTRFFTDFLRTGQDSVEIQPIQLVVTTPPTGGHVAATPQTGGNHANTSATTRGDAAMRARPDTGGGELRPANSAPGHGLGPVEEHTAHPQDVAGDRAATAGVN